MMKKSILSSLIFSMTMLCMGQFVPQPLNYPGPGYWAYYISIVDDLNVWVGTIHEFGDPCNFSARTTDGGDTWIFDSIPITGAPVCSSICSWDANTCFFVFHNTPGPGGELWSTTDAGSTWEKKNTTQFSTGFLNFYHAFSADTGVAMGDPVDGYFEIQVTHDGGNTWNRIPSVDIPEPLPGEAGFVNIYSAVGNSIWFSTNLGRCFRSTDKGMTWNVSEVVPGLLNDYIVCFSTETKGIFYRAGATTKLAVTNDGGVEWDTVQFQSGYQLMFMSSVAGFDGGFVLTAWKNFTDVFFTPDMFATVVVIGENLISNTAVDFLDATTGWIGGGESGNNEILKFTGLLTPVIQAARESEHLAIVPNPSSGDALVRIPGSYDSRAIQIRVTDLSGRIIETRHIASSTGWCGLNGGTYPNGTYLVTVLSEGCTVATQKWVVQH